jgi:hypothetical protein
VSEGTIFYTPAAGYVGSDTFTYGVLDGKGGTARATVHVDVRKASIPIRALAALFKSDGSILIQCIGIPGRTYQVQISADLIGWSPLGVATVAEDGTFTFVDSTASESPIRFYRITRP